MNSDSSKAKILQEPDGKLDGVHGKKVYLKPSLHLYGTLAQMVSNNTPTHPHVDSNPNDSPDIVVTDHTELINALRGLLSTLGIFRRS